MTHSNVFGGIYCALKYCRDLVRKQIRQNLSLNNLCNSCHLKPLMLFFARVKDTKENRTYIYYNDDGLWLIYVFVYKDILILQINKFVRIRHITINSQNQRNLRTATHRLLSLISLAIFFRDFFRTVDFAVRTADVSV